MQPTRSFEAVEVSKSGGPLPLPLPSSMDSAFINSFPQAYNIGSTKHQLSQDDNMSNSLKDFSKEDDLLIISLKHQRLSWAEISAQLSHRDCRKRYYTYVKDYDITQWSWTSSEDQLLCALVAQASQPDWSKISEILEDRTVDTCKRRWRKLWQVTKLGKPPIGHEKPWTAQETQELSKLYAEGTDWVHTSQNLTTATWQTRNLTKATWQKRTGSECMRRLQSENLLVYPNPVAKGNQWTAERKGLVETLRKAGETWEHISKKLESKGVYFSADECRGVWFNSFCEEYRLWIREDGTLKLPL